MARRSMKKQRTSVPFKFGFACSDEDSDADTDAKSMQSLRTPTSAEPDAKSMLSLQTEASSFTVDFTNFSPAKLKFLELYKYISTFTMEWQCSYDYCSNADDSRIRFYAQQYAHSNTLHSRLLQLTQDTSDMAYLLADASTTDSFIEYILLATKKVNGQRVIMIADCRQTKSISWIGVFLSLGIAGVACIGNPYAALGALVGKLAIDWGVSKVDVCKTFAICYLQKRKLVKVDLENSKIILNC